MSPLYAALISAATAVFMVLLSKLLGRRKENVEIDATVSGLWEKWSAEQGRRIEGLEERVEQLEADLTAARDKNQAQASLMSSLIGWALQLRDEVIRLGGHPLPAPAEVQAALTSLDPN